jgi:hypothetical protein
MYAKLLAGKVPLFAHITPGQGSDPNTCIFRDFGDNLNWKLESDTRRTPVWQSSVRKIMHSSPRFKHTADRAIFTFASPSTR